MEGYTEETGKTMTEGRKTGKVNKVRDPFSEEKAFKFREGC